MFSEDGGRQISVSSERARFDEATTQLQAFRTSIAPTAAALKTAEPWSLFDRDNHDAHFAAVRALNRASIDPRSVRARRPDNIEAAKPIPGSAPVLPTPAKAP